MHANLSIINPCASTSACRTCCLFTIFIHLQDFSSALPPSIAASVAAALPVDKTAEKEKKKKKKKGSDTGTRSFRSFVAMCETNAGKDIPDPTRPPSVKYSITMYNASKRQTKMRVVPFWKMPVKVLDIKEKIQHEYNIPKSFQLIYFRGKSLENEQTISEIGLYSGDALEVGSMFYQLVACCI